MCHSVSSRCHHSSQPARASCSWQIADLCLTKVVSDIHTPHTQLSVAWQHSYSKLFFAHHKQAVISGLLSGGKDASITLYMNLFSILCYSLLIGLCNVIASTIQRISSERCSRRVREQSFPSLQTLCYSLQRWCFTKCFHHCNGLSYRGTFFFPIKWTFMEEHEKIIKLQNYFMELLHFL